MTASGIALAPSRARPDEGRGLGVLGSPRLRRVGGLIGFALLVYVPMVLTHPGRVVADTKSYPYLDPDRFIGRIASLWDPNIGLGTVTHQNIGYLFPLGPFYWLTHGLLGMPAWVAQRLWFATLLFAAGMGVRYLLRTLDVRGPGVPVAMLVYALSPYATEFSARLSVLLGPWAALGFFLGFTIRALRDVRGWKYPALIALTVQIVGGVNATALLYALIAPALWVPYAIWVRRELRWRDAWSAIWRTGLLTGLTSLWWAVGLLIEGSYGMGILRFTESVAVVSHTSTATEIIRGLGYWFFYGGDVSGPWNDGVLDFTRRTGVIFVSFAIPGLAMLAAGFLRWKHRAFFIGLVVIGMVIAVAASPYDDPTVLGSLFKAFATSSTAGFALRSTARAVPMLVLGLAVLLGIGISAWWEAQAARGRGWIVVAAAVVVGVLCVANAPGLWRGRYYSTYLERDEEVPSYWQQALGALDAKGGDTRVLGFPGADFAAYRWGDTIDPIEPGLMDRPYVARELVPWGGEATTNLLIALDRRVQDRLLDPNALAPIARLMGVGDVLLRLDLQTDQFTLVSARGLWEDFTKHGTPNGLGAPTTYGTKTPGKLIGTDLGDPAEPPTPEPKPVAIFPVQNPQNVVRVHPAAGPLVIDGDGEGLVDAAGVGLLPDTRLIVPSAEYDESPKALRAHVPADAVLLVTDTNRRQGMRWQGMRNNYGYTEQAGEQPMRDDLLDQRLEIYPGITDRARTVVELRGLTSVRATTYGTPAFGFAPSARPANAFDGDARSAWEVAAGEPRVDKERLVAELARPVTTDHVRLQQAAHGARGRWITKVGVRLDDGPRHVYDIARRGKTRVEFPKQQFTKFDIQILATDANKVQAFATEAGRRRKTGVGFEEIEIKDDAPGSHTVRVHEVTRLPQDLLGSLGARSATHPLALLMTTPADTGTWRRFVLPTARSFSLSGTAHLNNAAKDSAVDAALGIPGAGTGGVTADSSERLANFKARASSAFDGDPTTAWNSRSRDLPGQWIKVTNSVPVTFDHLDLQLREDGRHSVPTRLRISTEDGATRTVDVPPVAPVDGISHVPVQFEPLHGRTIRITLDAVQPVTIRGANRAPITLPVGITEAGIPGVLRPPLPAEMPSVCQDAIVRVDGVYRGVRVTGTTAAAIDGQALPVASCEAGPLALGAGSHELRARAPRSAGLSVSQFLLLSDAHGEAVTPADFRSDLARRPAPTPTLTVTDRQRASTEVAYHGAEQPFWLVLGQSNNRGWHAEIGGHDLGPPQLVDGFANGWLVDPAKYGADATVSLRWTPQTWVWLALAVSGAAVLACLAILVGVRIRRRRRDRDDRVAPVEASGGRALVVNPFEPGEPVGSWRGAVGIGVAVALVTAAIVGAPWAVVAGLAAFAATRWRWARGGLRLLPAVLVGTIALYVTWGQYRHNYPPQFEWPLNFDRVRNVAWIAVVLLVVDVLVGSVRARARPGRDRAVTPPA